MLIVRLFAVLPVLLAAAQAPSEESHANISLEYFYFKEPVRLELDAHAIAFHARSGSEELAAATAALRGAGLDVVAARPARVRDWWSLELPASMQSREGISSILDALAATATTSTFTPVLRSPSGDSVLLSTDLLLRFNPDVSRPRRAEILRKLPVEIVDGSWHALPDSVKVRCRTNDGLRALRIANEAAQLSDVEFCEPDMLITGRSALTPSDSGFADTWGIHNTGQQGGTPDIDMDGPEAWNLTIGSSSVRVLILDDGVETTHVDLSPVIGADFTGLGGAGGPVDACDRHGTAVAGCIAARMNNSGAAVGIAPGCTLVSAKVYVSNGACDGSWTTQFSWTVEALAWAQQQGVRVTNNSNVFGTPSSAIAAKYTETSSSMVHFACTGNAGQGTISWPSVLPELQSVGAIRRTGLVWPQSNTGLGIDFVAPGEAIFTTDRTGTSGYDMSSYLWGSGTSFACAYAAGVAALAFSANPSLTPSQVVQTLRQTASDLGPSGYDTVYGWGLVNAASSVQLAATPPHTELVSVNSQGQQDAQNDSGGFPHAFYPNAISGDGLIVVFVSDSPALVSSDVNNRKDVFAHDRSSGQTTAVSTTPQGATASKGADDNDVSISADGRYVVFASSSFDILPPGSGTIHQVFRRDLQTGTTIRVSCANLTSTPGNDWSGRRSCRISANGRFVVFDSLATNLVALTSTTRQVFVRDCVANTTEMVSVSNTNQAGSGECYHSAISGDGRYVAFASEADNLVAEDTNQLRDVFVRDRVTATTTRISVSTAGDEANNWSGNLDISADGRFVVFESLATNLVSESGMGGNVFVHDRLTGVTARVSMPVTGQLPNTGADYPTITADGRYVAIHALADNLVAGDSNGWSDVVLVDRWTGGTERVSVGMGGGQPNEDAGRPAISADGRVIAFSSFASNLVASDANGKKCDVFARITGVPLDDIPTNFGLSKVSAIGCVPQISCSGVASASEPAPFVISANNVPSGSLGRLVYGVERDGFPFAAPGRYLAAPFRCLSLQVATGATKGADCLGTYATDFNTIIQTGTDPWLRPGSVIYCQYVYRDIAGYVHVQPRGSTGIGNGLTDGLRFAINP